MRLCAFPYPFDHRYNIRDIRDAMPAPPKLRSSCDRCGMAKVKCDRGQPECGRCISHGLPCVYGVSRKMGKPPRRASLSRTINTPIAAIQSNASTSSSSNASSDGMMLEFEPSSNGPDVPAWDPMEYNNSNHIMNSIDGGESFLHDLTMPCLPNLSLDFNEWATGDQHSFDLLSSQLLSSPSSSPKTGNQSSNGTYQMQWDEVSQFERSSIPPDTDNGHDCPRKSYEILESLSALNSTQTEYGQSPATGPTVGTGSPPHRVPLDLVLQLNREATERLVPLLACPCARLPHVALLYASIISRILAWYQQAADCTKPALPETSPSMTAASTLSPSDSSKSTPGSSVQSPGITVAPSRMAIGAFKVDDLRLQTAMKIHLLLGEMRRVKSLIDQLGSEKDSPASQEEFVIGDAGTLHQSLISWLKRDHTRILNMMRSELGDLNI